MNNHNNENAVQNIREPQTSGLAASRLVIGQALPGTTPFTMEEIQRLLGNKVGAKAERGSNQPEAQALTLQPPATSQPTLVERFRNQKENSAPLLRVLLEVEFADPEAGSTKDRLTAVRLLRWFTEERNLLLPCGQTCLVLREGRYLGLNRNGQDDGWVAQAELYFSMAQVNASPGTTPVCQEELLEAFQFSRSRWLRPDLDPFHRLVRVKEVVNDPGIPKPLVPACPRSGRFADRIVLQIGRDWSLKTCHLSGEHFYMPGPLGFCYEGDSTKPVAPLLANSVGFVIDEVDLLTLSRVLSTTGNLRLLPEARREASCVVRWWPDYVMGLNQSGVICTWPGGIYDLYQSEAPQEEELEAKPEETTVQA